MDDRRVNVIVTSGPGAVWSIIWFVFLFWGEPDVWDKLHALIMAWPASG